MVLLFGGWVRETEVIRSRSTACDLSTGASSIDALYPPMGLETVSCECFRTLDRWMSHG